MHVKLRAAGFADASIEPTRVYRAEDAKAFLAGNGRDFERMAEAVDGKFRSGFIRARKANV